MEKPRGARLLHQLLVVYQHVALYFLKKLTAIDEENLGWRGS